MAIIVTEFPQNVIPVTAFTIEQLLAALPDNNPYPINMWVGGKMAKHCIVVDNIIFIAEQDEEPSVEMKNYFADIIRNLNIGLTATVMNNWRDKSVDAIRLYNNGVLAIDRETKVQISNTDVTIYKTLPAIVKTLPILTANYAKTRFAPSIPWLNTIYFTGSVPKNGWSCNDADFILGRITIEGNEITYHDVIANKTLLDVQNYFTGLLGWKTHTGTKVMPEREPVVLYKLYENGILCLPQS